MAVDPEVIETTLERAASRFLAEFGDKEIFPGWRALFLFDFQSRQVGCAQIPYMEGEKLENLLKLAEKWPDAFDAARCLAASAIAAGIDLPSPLRV